jgi:drug/metabolite transporter (DMT)-like permease
VDGPSPWLGGSLALASAAMWALASVLWARIGRHVTPVGMNLGKGLVALAVLLALALATRFPVADLRGWALLGVSGVIGIALGDTAYMAALVRLGPHRLLVLTSLVPLVASGMAMIFLHERPGPRWFLGAALCVGGVAIVLRERLPERSDAGSWRAGVLLGGLTVLLEAAGITLAGAGVKGLGTEGAFDGTFIRLLCAVVALVGAGLPGLRLLGWLAPFRRPRLFVGLLLASLLGTFLGIGLSMAALAYTDVAVATVLNATSPLFVLPVWALVARERVSLRAVLGALAAVAGVAVLLTG